MLNWPSRELHRECPQPHTAYQDRISKNQISRTRFAEEPRPLNGVLERLFLYELRLGTLLLGNHQLRACRGCHPA